MRLKIFFALVLVAVLPLSAEGKKKKPAERAMLGQTSLLIDVEEVTSTRHHHHF